MNGLLPEELGDLEQLTLLALDDNTIEGTIPAQLGGLEQLTHLNLRNNRLQGTIPADGLGNLKQLVYLNLYGNRLSGTIPEELGGLGNLTELDLDHNQLEGPIPSRLGDLEQLTDLALGYNRLTGMVPALPFKNYTYCRLQALTSPTNKFTCPLPPVTPPPQATQTTPSLPALHTRRGAPPHMLHCSIARSPPYTLPCIMV
jgi:hypothetical protein